MPKSNAWTIFGRMRKRGWAISRIFRALKTFLPMLRDVVAGRYRPIPWAAFGWMVAALVYLISPLDLIPDFMILIGVLDDVVIVGWLLTKVDRSLASYRTWRGDDDARDITPGP